MWEVYFLVAVSTLWSRNQLTMMQQNVIVKVYNMQRKYVTCLDVLKEIIYSYGDVIHTLAQLPII